MLQHEKETRSFLIFQQGQEKLGRGPPYKALLPTLS